MCKDNQLLARENSGVKNNCPSLFAIKSHKETAVIFDCQISYQNANNKMR